MLNMNFVEICTKWFKCYLIPLLPFPFKKHDNHFYYSKLYETLYTIYRFYTILYIMEGDIVKH